MSERIRRLGIFSYMEVHFTLDVEKDLEQDAVNNPFNIRLDDRLTNPPVKPMATTTNFVQNDHSEKESVLAVQRHRRKGTYAVCQF